MGLDTLPFLLSDQFITKRRKQIKFDRISGGQAAPGIPQFNEELVNTIFENLAVRADLSPVSDQGQYMPMVEGGKSLSIAIFKLYPEQAVDITCFVHPSVWHVVVVLGASDSGPKAVQSKKKNRYSKK